MKPVTTVVTALLLAVQLATHNLHTARHVRDQLDFSQAINLSGAHLPDPCDCKCHPDHHDTLDDPEIHHVGIIHITALDDPVKSAEQIRCVSPDLSSWALKTRRYKCVPCDIKYNATA